MELPRNRTLMSERITTILDEIANRYDSDIILSRNTMKLIDIMRISKIYHEELINKIEKGYIEEPEAKNTVRIFEFFALQGRDITSLTKSAVEKNFFINCKRNTLVRLHLMYSKCNKSEIYNEWVELIENHEEYSKENYDFSLDYICDSPFIRHNLEMHDNLIKTFVIDITDNLGWVSNGFSLSVNRTATFRICKAIRENNKSLESFNSRNLALFIFRKMNSNYKIGNN